MYMRWGRRREPTDPYIVLELNAARGVKLDLLQRLSHNIVRLALALLGGLDGRSFVQVAMVVDVEFAEGI